jgi:DNA-binding response OmpR family regulator
MNNKKIILVLEDEVEFLQTLGALLRDQGYEVMEVTTGEAGLQRLHEKKPDLIIADIKLPGIDGFDFFTEMRKKKTYRSIPFIYLTAFNNLEAAKRAKQDGAADYITKPFELDYLISRVRELLPT